MTITLSRPLGLGPSNARIEAPQRPDPATPTSPSKGALSKAYPRTHEFLAHLRSDVRFTIDAHRRLNLSAEEITQRVLFRFKAYFEENHQLALKLMGSTTAEASWQAYFQDAAHRPHFEQIVENELRHFLHSLLIETVDQEINEMIQTQHDQGLQGEDLQQSLKGLVKNYLGLERNRLDIIPPKDRPSRMVYETFYRYFSNRNAYRSLLPRLDTLLKAHPSIAKPTVASPTNPVLSDLDTSSIYTNIKNILQHFAFEGLQGDSLHNQVRAFSATWYNTKRTALNRLTSSKATLPQRDTPSPLWVAYFTTRQGFANFKKLVERVLQDRQERLRVRSPQELTTEVDAMVDGFYQRRLPVQAFNEAVKEAALTLFKEREPSMRVLLKPGDPDHKKEERFQALVSARITKLAPLSQLSRAEISAEIDRTIQQKHHQRLTGPLFKDAVGKAVQDFLEKNRERMTALLISGASKKSVDEPFKALVQARVRSFRLTLPLAFEEVIAEIDRFIETQRSLGLNGDQFKAKVADTAQQFLNRNRGRMTSLLNPEQPGIVLDTIFNKLVQERLLISTPSSDDDDTSSNPRTRDDVITHVRQFISEKHQQGFRNRGVGAELFQKAVSEAADLYFAHYKDQIREFLLEPGDRPDQLAKRFKALLDYQITLLTSQFSLSVEEISQDLDKILQEYEEQGLEGDAFTAPAYAKAESYLVENRPRMNSLIKPNDAENMSSKDIVKERFIQLLGKKIDRIPHARL